MSRLSLLLSFWVLLGVGCRHANVPVLPASHGHLSHEMQQYLELRAPPATDPLASGAPEVVVEPDQAPTLFAEATQVLKGSPTKDQVHQAWEDLRAACDADFEEACAFLRKAFERPEKEEFKPVSYPLDKTYTTCAATVARCRLDVDGRFRGCEVLERAPFGFTEAFLESIQTAKFRPAKLAGHPIETPYTFTAVMTIGKLEEVPAEQRLQWAQARVKTYPKSTAAWDNLAQVLAKQAPEGPEYSSALRQLHNLSPRYWWPANELAWLHVQGKRYAEAAPLAKRARRESGLNPYVLETSAAVQFGLGQCAAALADQQQAVAKLPAEWPEPERERFQQTLREYEQRCAARPQ